MNRLSFIIGMALLATGCAETIKDRDFEAEERAYIKQYGENAKKDPQYQAPTKPDMMIGKEDKIYVMAIRKPNVRREHLDLQKWDIVVNNHNTGAKCVKFAWKLMDFELISNYPEWTYVKPDQIVKYGEMNQTVWDMSGTKFALPPSGYIDKMVVLDPTPKNDCDYQPKTVENL